MSNPDLLYDDKHISFLEDIWGEGFLSPGGGDEVKRVLSGLELTGKRVLDIGCGSGAVAVLMVTELGAAEVVGIDVETPVCAAAQRRVAQANLNNHIDIRLVKPGPLDFEAESFDLVFSKDSILHIPNKEVLAKDVVRILRPGGWLAASDWLTSHDGKPSDDMRAYLVAEDLDFAMASASRYHRALQVAGLEDVVLTNRNPWYCAEAQKERDFLTGPNRQRLSSRHGADFITSEIATWDAMIKVLKSGEHCPHHIRARKPK